MGFRVSNGKERARDHDDALCGYLLGEAIESFFD
jgi:hypothetical protein